MSVQGAEVPLAHGADALPEGCDLLAPLPPDCRWFSRLKASPDSARHVLDVSDELTVGPQLRCIHRGAASTDRAEAAPAPAGGCCLRSPVSWLLSE
jgi:hypothetical protein